MPDLSIVIVTWNVRDLLRDCLHSIQESCGGPDLDVIVIDSASTDDTAQMIRREFPAVRLIEPGANIGFSKGNNLGIEASTGRYLLILNPDTRVRGQALGELVSYLDTHPEVGVIGPQLLNPDGTIQSSSRRFPTLWTGIFESTWLQPIAPRCVLRRYYMLDFQDDETVQADWVSGAAFVVRREAIEQVGGFDESFFMYSEEIDWQKRIKEAGWQVVYYPQAQVLHYGGKASEQVAAQRHIHFQTSKVQYFHKHHGPLAGTFMRLYLLNHYALQLVLEGMKGLVGHKRQLRKERARAYWQVLRSGLKGS
jgi:GT2 family glycosyltransferase